MKHNQPLIGITCDEDPNLGQFRSPMALSRAIERGCGIPLLLSSHISSKKIPDLVRSLGGVVIAGGAFDISPSYYGEKKKYRVDPPQGRRSTFEFCLIRESIRQKRPVLGICGGMQAINVVLGGTLYQDLSSQLPYVGCHEQKTPKSKPSHLVNVVKGSQIHRWVQVVRMKTNSTHHQAVKDLGKGLEVCGFADDGVIEAIEGKWVLGVQWHPEVLGDRVSRRLLREFVKMCM